MMRETEPSDRRDDHAFVREVTARINQSSPDGAAELLSGLVEQLREEAVFSLMERLPPVRDLDYAPHRIQLLVSSPEIRLRLVSVEKEPFTVEWIERSIRAGDVFYDIGANVGAYSLIAAKATNNGARIFAFEPMAASFHDLFRNILLNDCSTSVIPLPIALWSDNGTLTLTTDSRVAGAARHRISPKPPVEADAKTTVVGVRLDDLVERFGLPAPTHAKIDTDGYELEVLRGAERTLTRPEWRSIIVEFDRGETPRNQAIKTLLVDAGFDAGHQHERLASPSFPHPEGRPDVYWTFARLPTHGLSRVSRPARPRSDGSRPMPFRAARVRAAAATVLVVSFLFLIFAALPEALGDRPYNVFGH